MTYDIAAILEIYRGSNGDATMALYQHLKTLGWEGSLAVDLFRACKASERAKLYRGGERGRGSYRRMAYDKKTWAIENLSKALMATGGITWGWGIDAALKERGDPHHHVIYVELPTGQISFHTGTRNEGPDYPGEWDGMRGQTADRICRWVGRIVSREKVA